MGWVLGIGIGTLAAAAAAAAAWAVYLRPVDVAAPPPLRGSYEQMTLEHGGRTRSYGLYLPRPGAAARGIVVVLHGSLGSGAQFRRWSGHTFDVLADRLGVAVVYPDGWKGHWNDCRRAGTYAAKAENVDDTGFVDHVIARVAEGRRTRLGAVGYSNGGFMALRWALEGSATLDGIVLVGAGVPAASNMLCAEGRRPPRALLVAGTADGVSPYGGGRVTLLGSDRGEVQSAAESARWLAGPGAAEVLTSPHAASTGPVHRRAWRGDHGSHAGLVTLEGGGHTVPQPWTRFPRLLGATIHSVDVAALAAQLFEWE